jgi:hypothetical protein
MNAIRPSMPEPMPLDRRPDRPLARRPDRGARPRRHVPALVPIVAVIALVVAAPTGTPRAAVAEPAGPMSTADFLDLPELFQLSVVAGSLAVLERWADVAADSGAGACYKRWTAPEDVAAIVSLHVRRDPGSAELPFAETLMRALAERCTQL